MSVETANHKAMELLAAVARQLARAPDAVWDDIDVLLSAVQLSTALLAFSGAVHRAAAKILAARN